MGRAETRPPSDDRSDTERKKCHSKIRMMNIPNSSVQQTPGPYGKRQFNIGVLVYVTLLLVLIYLTITAWDELIDYLLLISLQLNKDELTYHLVMVLITSLILIFYFYILNEDVRSLLGIELI